MLLIIGGRYRVFATVYGMRLYWALGLALATAGFAPGYLAVPARVAAATGAVLEAAFAVVFLLQHRRWVRPDNWTKMPAANKNAGCEQKTGDVARDQ